MIRLSKKSSQFDKYDYYTKSVQAPESDVDFLAATCEQVTGKVPLVLGEDFCGTFANCCHWVQRSSRHQAVGVDLDPEPIAYGKKHYESKLESEQIKRLRILKKNVMDTDLPKADLICALNFSYFIFKQRQELLAYFRNVRSRLNTRGCFTIDCFGGPKCHEANVEKRVIKPDGFVYYWDQVGYDYVNNHAKFHIHFKPKGQKIIREVFTYDWRLWSIAELRDVLMESGFKKVEVYVEGSDEDGDGNGEFEQVDESYEECEAWIAYLLATF